jgi:DNA-binding NarL/FixJ family response regulator
MENIERDQDPAPEKLVLWIVEDNDEFGRQLSALINLSPSFACDRVFRSCEPALQLLAEESPPDILLMDIGLPGMNGIEGVRRAKAIAPALQVVILTVFDDTGNIVQAISAGASGYLHKGSSLETIVESLKSILTGGAPINPQIAKTILEVFAAASPPVVDYGLTPREKEVLNFLIEGLPKKQIADRLFVTFHTIDKHLRNIYGKLQVQSRSGAVAKVLKGRIR